jgi:hypothetical protein
MNKSLTTRQTSFGLVGKHKGQKALHISLFYVHMAVFLFVTVMSKVYTLPLKNKVVMVCMNFNDNSLT